MFDSRERDAMFGAMIALSLQSKAVSKTAKKEELVVLIRDIGLRLARSDEYDALLSQGLLEDRALAEKFVKQVNFHQHTRRYNTTDVERIGKVKTLLCSLHGLPEPEPIPYYRYAAAPLPWNLPLPRRPRRSRNIW